jgi:hypothetical protein
MKMNSDELLQSLVPISDDDDDDDKTDVIKLMRSAEEEDANGTVYTTKEKEEERSSCSVPTSYQNKSLFELERDADRILDDIRNIGKNDNKSSNARKSCSTIMSSNSTNKNSGHNHREIYRRTQNSTIMTPPDPSSDDESSQRIVRIATDTSVVTGGCDDSHLNGVNEFELDGPERDQVDHMNDDDDDDSIIGELQRLESVTTTIRLSLIDTTNAASLLALAQPHHSSSKSAAPSNGRTVDTTTAKTTVSTTTTTTTITTNRKGLESGHPMLHGSYQQQEDYDPIIQRSGMISILIILCLWMIILLWWHLGDWSLWGTFLSVNEQGVLTLAFS